MIPCLTTYLDPPWRSPLQSAEQNPPPRPHSRAPTLAPGGGFSESPRLIAVEVCLNNEIPLVGW